MAATFRTLSKNDLPAATGLSCRAGWNQTEEDWRMLLRLAPEGCLGADVDGKLAATATLICYGKQLGWVGMVLTDPAYRRRGLARSLVTPLLELADARGIESVKLDATDQGQHLYESLGFRAEQPVERWWRAGTDARTSAQRVPPDESAIFEADCEAYAADRSAMLRALVERSETAASGEGFGLCRSGMQHDYVGPLIARNREEARALVACFSGRSCYWDLLPANAAALTLASEFGFAVRRQLVRMVRGRDLCGRQESIYGIAGFELG